MLKINKSGIALLLSASALLTACGGGGGAAPTTPTGPVVSTLSFPLQSADKTIIANGFAKTMLISGTCSGTGSNTASPATTPAVFEGLPGFSSIRTITMSFTNCTPVSIAQTATAYYDNNYLPHGMNSVGNYGVFLTPPTIPASVTVGGTGVIGTATLYTDSTKLVGNGRQDGSYVIEADTANTAIVNFIWKIYNAAGVLSSTSQVRFRIAMTGALVPLSEDIQHATGTHLLLTYQ